MLLNWRKKRLRAKSIVRRAQAARAAPDAAALLATHFPDAAWPRIDAVVAGYRPFAGELDPTPLMETFFCEQARLALPVVVSRDAPLEFRSWKPGETLERGVLNIDVPPESAPRLDPDLLLVPLLAVDRKGGRLGYGKGYYDRTLAALRAKKPIIAVGLAYEAQLVGAVPTGRHDETLDWIVTEKASYPVA